VQAQGRGTGKCLSLRKFAPLLMTASNLWMLTSTVKKVERHSDLKSRHVLGTFDSVTEVPKRENIQMKATEQYFPVVQFVALRKVVSAFESVIES